MPVYNKDIADLFNKTADLLEIKGENPYRIRAYRNAASKIQGLSNNIVEMISDDKEIDLTQFSGIGNDLANKIKQIADNGSFRLLEKLKKEIPVELLKLMNVQGLGPKRISKLSKKLGISGLNDLKQTLNNGDIQALEGFGKKTEQNIYHEITRLEKQPQQKAKLSEVEQIALSISQYLKKAKGIKQLVIAGSFRRHKETVRDLDILTTCKRGHNIMDYFLNYEDVQKVLSKGKTKSSVFLKSRLQVDLRVVPQVSYGAALLYFTGSKEHNVALRKIAIKKKYKLNEYGLFEKGKRVAGKTETSVYKKLNLSYIEPELRENRDELDAAQENKLPHLVTAKDILGDLHTHSIYTDGNNTIKEMAQAAKRMGYQYIAITDHSKHLTVAGGLKSKALKQQLKKIDRLNEKMKDFTILKSCEVEILEDGSLDLSDDILKQLDFRICSIHHKFNLSKEKQTQRILTAMDHPLFNILGHPTGRLINKRNPYQVDMKKILKAAKKRGCFVEVNAHPDRLDLNDLYCKMAKEMGTRIVVSTDAHNVNDLNYMRFGISQARRGWLESKDIINTKPLNTLKKLLTRS